MPTTPHHLDSPRLEMLGGSNPTRPWAKPIHCSNNSKTWGCKGRNLYGYYQVKNELVVICQGFHNDDIVELIETLKNEGSHPAQHRCHNLSLYLNDQQIAAPLPHVMQSTYTAITQNNDV